MRRSRVCPQAGRARGGRNERGTRWGGGETGPGWRSRRLSKTSGREAGRRRGPRPSHGATPSCGGGSPEEHAGWVVEGLIEASLRGIDTHGVRLFPTYIAELDGGRSLARPELRWGSAGGTRPRASWTPGDALGLVAGRMACARGRAAGPRATASAPWPCATPTISEPPPCYTLEMARQGVLVGVSFTNSDALVAPYNGLRPFFGTDPLAGGGAARTARLFCADFATSQVSYSKVKAPPGSRPAAEPGWASGRTGRTRRLGRDAALEPLGGAGPGTRGKAWG